MAEELMNITILVVLIVIMPIIPAYILYKSLPARTTVSGPFKGLNIQLTGAFGGYFVVVLLIAGFITGYMHMKQMECTIFTTFPLEITSLKYGYPLTDR